MNEHNTIKASSHQWMKKFIPIWSAQIFSLLGSGLVQFALVWWLTKETGSTTILAMATFVAVLPNVLIAPFAGALVDRWNRRLVMIIADGSVALVTLGLAILFAMGKIEVWHIFIALFLRETGGVFHWPAMQASTSLMVPEEHLARVAGINTALRGGMNIIAPPLGALLMSLLVFYQVIAIDILTAALAITPLLFIRIPQPASRVEKAAYGFKPLMRDTVEGFRFMKAWPGIMILVTTCALLNFILAPSGTFMPLLVTQHFQMGVWELSILESALGIGVVAGGLVLGVWGGFKSKIVTSMCGVIGLGTGVLLTGIAPANAFPLAVVGMSLTGFMNPITNGPMDAILQSKVPPDMQGRVMGLTNSICMAMMPLAMLISAPVVNWLGLRFWYWAGGGVTILAGAVAFFIPQLMDLDKVKSEIAEAAVVAG